MRIRTSFLSKSRSRRRSVTLCAVEVQATGLSCVVAFGEVAFGGTLSADFVTFIYLSSIAACGGTEGASPLLLSTPAPPISTDVGVKGHQIRNQVV